MNGTGGGTKTDLQRVEELAVQGEALLEARRNPEKGEAAFPAYGDVYRAWYEAGKKLIERHSEERDVKQWDMWMCRGMYSLKFRDEYLLTHQERQQGMLVALRERLRAERPPEGPGASAGSPAVRVEGLPAEAGPAAQAQVRTPEPAAGTSETTPPFELTMTASQRADELLLEELRQAAGDLGKKTVTKREYRLQGRSSVEAVIQRFSTWNNALEAAGLELSAHKQISTAQLFKNLARVWRATGRQPRKTDMVKPRSEFSARPYTHRFGNWQKALKAFAEWAAGTGKPGEDAAGAAPPGDPLKVPAKLRYQVLKRDSFKCTACGRTPANEPGVELQMDHRIPRNRGGRTTLDNRRTLCERCNKGKGAG